MPPRARLPAVPVTPAPYESPYQTAMSPMGTGGLNLRDAPDALDPTQLTRATNINRRGAEPLQSRDGQQLLIETGGTDVHSGARLDDPLGDASTRIYGVDTTLHSGFSGGSTEIDTGYSGDPLSLVTKRPDHSGQSWMYVGDRSRMRKVRVDGLDLPIGLPQAALTSTALVAEQKTQVAHFDTTDTTEAAAWGAPVFEGSSTGWSASTVDDTDGQSGNAVEFRIQYTGGSAPAANRNPVAWFPLTRTLDLSKVGTREATDDDLFQLWAKIVFSTGGALLREDPTLIGEQIEELRLYFVTDPAGAFDPATLPGSKPLATTNRNAFMKTIRHNELTRSFTGYASVHLQMGNEANVLAAQDFVEEASNASKTSATTRLERIAARSRSGRIRPNGLRRERPRKTLKPVVPPTTALQTPAALNVWEQYGAIGQPFRRSSFFEIGDPDWSQVTGIIVYMRLHTRGGGYVAMSLDDFYLTGGYGPDASDATAEPYDVRVTHFDPRTGTEGNPSDEQTNGEPDADGNATVDQRLSPLRRGIVVTPTAFGDADMRQRIYVRGGFNNIDWFRAGVNDADGGTFTITDNDDALAAAATLELDHDEPVTTQDSTGATIRAQPVPILIDLGTLLLGLGDPYRPGHLYWTIPNEFGHWPPQNTEEVCPPGEELMGGVGWGGQAYLFSRRRMFVAYQNATSPGTVISTNTPCTRGLISRWAVTASERAIYAVDGYGLYRTTGGEAQDVSGPISPLFHRTTAHDYLPINLTADTAMRLVATDGRVYFQYVDTENTRYLAVFDERQDQWIGLWTFDRVPSALWTEPQRGTTGLTSGLYQGGLTTGNAYALTDDATSDDGAAIVCTARTGLLTFGLPREQKQLGDAILDLDARFTQIDATFRLDLDTVANAASSVPATSNGRGRQILDAFGTVPQHSESVSLSLGWSSSTQRPRIYQYGIAVIPQPEETSRRSTQWDNLGTANEKRVHGFMVECDTFGAAKNLIPEYDLNGVVNAVDTSTMSPSNTVTSNGRHRFFFSWPHVKAHLVRLRPDNACAPWKLYQLAWMADPEPPRIALVDSGDEERGDSYHTGLDLIIDTFNVAKTFEIYVDGVLQTNPAGGTTYSVTANGKQVVHLTMTPGYGHIYRYRATDTNVCLLYTHRWYLAPQPTEQTNLTQGLTVAGTRADKQLKGVVLEIDTGNVAKQIRVEVDGTDVETFTVTTARRATVHHAFTGQHEGRVFRVHSTDSVRCRVWPPIEGLFDIEPLSLTEWRTQPTTHGVDGWQIPLMAEICYRSTAAVTLTVTTVISTSGTTAADTYATDLPSTSGVKQKRTIFFNARKGLLFTYVFTASSAFHLYREESEVHLQPLGNRQPHQRLIVKPFGNDAMDPGRGMSPRAVDADVPATGYVDPPVPTAP